MRCKHTWTNTFDKYWECSKCKRMGVGTKLLPPRRASRDSNITPKELASRARNWRIFQLRSMWQQAGNLLDRDLSTEVRNTVDLQLQRLLAEPETDRRMRR
jgi:hypothetical protein